ncbi:MAG: hypothetical protein ACI3XA_06845 [Clostridia bacterium]
MDKKVIEDSEVLYRAALTTMPDSFDEDGETLPALFMDDKGASVERDGERDEQTILEVLKNKFFGKIIGVVKITAGECRDCETYPIATHNFRNQYHAEVHGSPTQIEINTLKALQLADACIRVL